MGSKFTREALQVCCGACKSKLAPTQFHFVSHKKPGISKKEELLSQTGEEFELTLLLSQTEALNYAWHLSKVASENDPQPDRAHVLTEISGNMKSLYQEVFALLLSKTKSPATNQ